MAGIEMINDFTESSKAIIESSGNRVRCLNSVMPSTCKGSVLKLSWQTLSLDYFPLFPWEVNLKIRIDLNNSCGVAQHVKLFQNKRNTT